MFPVCVENPGGPTNAYFANTFRLNDFYTFIKRLVDIKDFIYNGKVSVVTYGVYKKVEFNQAIKC